MSGAIHQRGGVEMPQQPIVVVASLLCIGIVVGWMVLLSWWQLLMFGAILLALFCYCPRWWMALVLLLYTGLSVTMIHRIASGDISGSGDYLVRVVSEAMGESRGVLRVESRVGDDGVWRGCYGEVRYRATEGVDLRRGDRAIVRCRVGEFRARHYTWLSQWSVVEHLSRDEAVHPRWHERLNAWASSRLHSLGLDHEAEMVVQAMLLGRRDMLSEELTASYRRSGAAHILAVSGLHVVIIYLLISRLLYLLHIIPFGFRLRPLLSAVVVWGYAMVVGMTPSVERAAIMFVVLQLLSLLSRRYFSLSGLSIAVAAMMIVDPRVVFDVGFMLSVVAVLSILVWVAPLDRAFGWWSRDLFGGVKIMRWITSSLVSIVLVGVVCSLATLPLVSWAFGYISLFGVLLNPIVVITAYLLISLSLIWVAIPLFEPLAPMFRFMINHLAALQNGAVEYMSSGWRDAVDIRISSLSMVAIYLLYIVMSVAFTQLDRQLPSDACSPHERR